MAKSVALALAAAGLVAFAIWLVSRVGTDDHPPSIAPAAARDAAAIDTFDAASASPRRSPKKPVPPPDPIDPAIERDLADPDPKVRLVRVGQLIEEGDAPAALLAASRDRDEAVSTLATEGLGKLYAAGRIPLEALVERHEDRALSAKARTAALEAIGLVASDEGAHYLAELAGRGDADQRRAVALLLAKQPRTIAVPALQSLARDGDPTTRQLANASLRTLGAE